MAFVYAGVTLTLSELTGDVYLSVLIAGCVELVATLVAHFWVTHSGRKTPATVFLLTAGISLCLAVPFDIFPGKHTVLWMMHVLYLYTKSYNY